MVGTITQNQKSQVTGFHEEVTQVTWRSPGFYEAHVSIRTDPKAATRSEQKTGATGHRLPVQPTNEFPHHE